MLTFMKHVLEVMPALYKSLEMQKFNKFWKNKICIYVIFRKLKQRATNLPFN